MLFDSLLVACAIPLAVVIAVQFSFHYFGARLVTVYLINFLTVVSVFLHAEIVFRTNFPEYIIEDLYTLEDGFYFNKPYLQKRFIDKEFAVDYITNSQGFRIGYGQNPDDSLMTADWLFIGDSFTQGAQVNFEELYTSRLYELFPDKIIANAGISGLGIVEEYNYYRRQGYRLGADTVFLQIGSFNDFMKVEPRQLAVTDYLMHHSDFLRFLLQDLKYENPAELPLGRWTEPFYPDRENNENYNIFYRGTTPSKQEDLELFEKYLRLFKEETEKHNAKLIVVLLPTKEQISLKYFNEVITSFEIDPLHLDMLRPNTFLNELSQTLNIKLIDLLVPLRETSDDVFFSYDEHLSPFGHQLMAEQITQHVSRNSKTSPTLMSSELVGDRYPMFSEDGRYITYQSFRDGNMELFIADSEFRNETRLTFNDVDESHPMLSRDNTRIVFTQGNQESFQTEVVVMNIDGSSREVITADAQTFGAIPTFSSDNRYLAFAEWSYQTDRSTYTNPQIVLLDTITADRIAITDGSHESWRPVFAPSGRQLAYISKRNEQFDLFLFDLEAKSETQLTNTPFDEWDPQFSRDGQSIVYAAHQNSNWDLFILDLDTNEVRQLTRTKGDEWDPSFSPDGSSILFAGRFGLVEAVYRLPLTPED